MKKIVLTSCGVIDEKLKNEFKGLFNKSMEDLKMLYIPLAADVEEGNKSWVNKEFETILNLGITKENILEYRMNYELDINDFDLIYMLGGNTYYLLSEIRKSGFDKKIEEALNRGVVYVGSSAGSIIMGNTIETSRDENKYIEDLTGLKYLNGIIIPHANKRKEYIDEQIKKYSDRIYAISDMQGIIIIDDKILDL